MCLCFNAYAAARLQLKRGTGPMLGLPETLLELDACDGEANKKADRIFYEAKLQRVTRC